jgi:hypothetical protein
MCHGGSPAGQHLDGDKTVEKEISSVKKWRRQACPEGSLSGQSQPQY